MLYIKWSRLAGKVGKSSNFGQKFRILLSENGKLKSSDSGVFQISDIHGIDFSFLYTRNGTEHLISEKARTTRVFEIVSGQEGSEMYEELLHFLNIVENETQQISKIKDGSVEKITLSRYLSFSFLISTVHTSLKYDPFK